jgi:ATP-dependent exoDNAse (exonuclease V) alpha subunit
MFHLNVRVAWHDNRWNGAVCTKPSANSFCVDLERVREERKDAIEDRFAAVSFSDLKPEHVPPCRAESGVFMNREQWTRYVEHPYASIKKANATHGHLKKTKLTVAPFSTFAVPFYWMLRQNQEAIDERLPEPLPPDEESPFASPWVFSRRRQEGINSLFFGRLTAGTSLVFFYTKGGHPLPEPHSRLLVGVGVIEKLSPILEYDTSKAGDTYPLWERLFHHSIRADKANGFLLPYHDYLASTGDAKEDAKRRDLLAEIAVVPEAADILEYSYGGELAGPDVALSALVKSLEAVRAIRRHGISPGPWAEREDWLNEQIEAAWRDRGAFPGTGAALEALGMRLGTSMALEILATSSAPAAGDPWPTLDAMLRGKLKPPQKAYEADLKAVANTWAGLSDERRTLLKLLSRFSLSSVQAARWFDPVKRAKAVRTPVTDGAILANPYRIAEADLGDVDDYPISISTIDRGMLPEATVAVAHPIEGEARVESPLDARRVRAGIVSVLRRAATAGDALFSESDSITGLGKLDLSRPCVVPSDWLRGNHEYLSEEVKPVDILINPERDEHLPCLQLVDLYKREKRLAELLAARAKTLVSSLSEDWERLLVVAIREGGGTTDPKNPRHQAALTEQAQALEQLTTRKLSVLVGRAGTGKTTVLGALQKSEKLSKEGVLFLAPTGKARVRLAQKANATAMTVAQFLYQLKRYDGLRQRTLFEGKEQYQKERTVVIDECSMLTMDDMLAVLLALDLGHVQRVILVGDPNQLPPIGVGRPFADLVAHLDAAKDRKEPAAEALARLTVELRTAAGAPSDTLRLASWFTREMQPVDADRVLSDIESGGAFNDLEICYWKTPADLHKALESQFVKRLGLNQPDDVLGFNAALGLTKEGWVPFDNHDGSENFQLLSPVRMHPHGVHALNRWVQQRYRGAQLASAREEWGLKLGVEEIVWGDKVILNRNGKRDGWNGKTKQKVEDEYLANGEIGVACSAQGAMKGKALNVAFANRPDVRFAFWSRSFSDDSGPLELAYALTVHKAQGSEFGSVFVVLPKKTQFLTRELVYTALTRAKNNLVLLLEGSDRSALYDLSRPTNSETARRNTNLFQAGVRRDGDEFPYAAHLVHRTLRDEMVQSKSELAIANYLAAIDLPYHYNRPLHGTTAPGKVYPDFTFVSDAGETILWEHLGMLDRDDYKRGWDWKREWYSKNGFEVGRNLFTSTEGPGLDMTKVKATAEAVRKALQA